MRQCSILSRNDSTALRSQLLDRPGGASYTKKPARTRSSSSSPTPTSKTPPTNG